MSATDRLVDVIAGAWPNFMKIAPFPHAVKARQAAGGRLRVRRVLQHDDARKSGITDSGGVIEETTVMGVACVTVRDTTERPETVTVGIDGLIGTEPAALKPALDRFLQASAIRVRSLGSGMAAPGSALPTWCKACFASTLGQRETAAMSCIAHPKPSRRGEVMFGGGWLSLFEQIQLVQRRASTWAGERLANRPMFSSLRNRSATSTACHSSNCKPDDLT
jgi:UDP-N-acetylglucosamine 2-epimerase